MRLPGGQLQNVSYQVNRDSKGYVVNIFYDNQHNLENTNAPPPPGNLFNPEPSNINFNEGEAAYKELIRHARIINDPPPPHSAPRAESVTTFKKIPVVLRPKNQQNPVPREKRKFVRGGDGRFDIFAYHNNETDITNGEETVSELPTTVSKTFDQKQKPLIHTISDKNNADIIHYEEITNDDISETTPLTAIHIQPEEDLVIVEGITADAALPQDSFNNYDDSSFSESISHETVLNPNGIHLVFDSNKNISDIHELKSESDNDLNDLNLTGQDDSEIEPIYYNPDRVTEDTIESETEDEVATILYLQEEEITHNENTLGYTNSESFRNSESNNHSENTEEIESVVQEVTLPAYIPSLEEDFALYPANEDNPYPVAYPSIQNQYTQASIEYLPNSEEPFTNFIDKSAQIQIAQLDPASNDDEFTTITSEYAETESALFESSKVPEDGNKEDTAVTDSTFINLAEPLPKAQPIVSQLSYNYGQPYYYSNPIVQENHYPIQHQPNLASYGHFKQFVPEPVFNHNQDIDISEINFNTPASSDDSFEYTTYPSEEFVEPKTGITIVKLDHQSNENIQPGSEPIEGLENGITVWQSVQLGTMKPVVLSMLSGGERKKDNSSIIITKLNNYTDIVRTGKANFEDEDAKSSVTVLKNNDGVLEEIVDEDYLQDLNDIVEKIFDETEQVIDPFIPEDTIEPAPKIDSSNIVWGEESLVESNSDLTPRSVGNNHYIIINEEEPSPSPSFVESLSLPGVVTTTPSPASLVYSLSSSKFQPVTTQTPSIPPKKKSIVVKNLPTYSGYPGEPIKVVEYMPLKLMPVKVTTGKYPTVKKLPSLTKQLPLSRGSVRSFKLPPIFYGGWQPIG